MQELVALHPLALGERQDGGGDRSARVDDGLQVRIVEIEGVRRGAVHERGQHDVELVAAPEHGRLPRSGKLGERSERAFHRLVAGGSDRATDPVEERPRRLVPHLLRHVGVAVSDDESCERSCNFHSDSFRRYRRNFLSHSSTSPSPSASLYSFSPSIRPRRARVFPSFFRTSSASRIAKPAAARSRPG